MKAGPYSADGRPSVDRPCSPEVVLQPSALRQRPTMISAKYRLKEERRKVLKMSVAKLRRIDDPEAALYRSVLINNTLRRLQREARQEKLHKQQTQQESRQTAADPPALVLPPSDDDFPVEFPSEPVAVAVVPPMDTAASMPLLCADIDDLGESLRKRLMDDDEDCDVHDVLSQFYMPPTPRMVTAFDEDEEVDIETVTPCERSASSALASLVSVNQDVNEPPSKRLRLADPDQEHALADPTNMLEDFKDDAYLNGGRRLLTGLEESLVRTPLAACSAANTTATCQHSVAAAAAACAARRFSGHDRENIAPASCGVLTNSQAASAVGMAAAATATATVSVSSPGEQPSQAYSCGHSNLFGDLRGGVVFHTLMASMES